MRGVAWCSLCARFVNDDGGSGSREIPVWTPRAKLTLMTNLLQGRKP